MTKCKCIHQYSPDLYYDNIKHHYITELLAKLDKGIIYGKTMTLYLFVYWLTLTSAEKDSCFSGGESYEKDYNENFFPFGMKRWNRVKTTPETCI